MHANVLEAPTQQHDVPVPGQTARSSAVSFLDSSVPLKNASHGDVLRYEVQTIWRNAECRAILTDGRSVKLSDAWQFIGYTGKDPVRRLLFRSNGSHIEVRLNADRLIVAVEAQHTGYALHKLMLSMKRTLATFFATRADCLIRVLDRERTYTSVDGGLISLADS